MCITVLNNLGFFCSLLGYEGLEVVNPEGGQDDVEEEAIKGRFKQEVRFSPSLLEARDWYYSGIFSGTFLSEMCCSRTAVYWHGARSSICKKTGDFHFKISRVCKSDRQQNEAYSQNLSYLFIEPEIKFYVSLLSRQTSWLWTVNMGCPTYRCAKLSGPF